jgi:predicted Holliday junction resolvase-like endonuclease
MDPLVFWIGALALSLFLTIVIATYRVQDKEIEELKQRLLLQGSASESHYRNQLDFYLNEVNRLSREEAEQANQAEAYRVELAELKSQQQSKSTRLGQLSEQAIGLLPNFPFDIKEMRFLGSPIDYIAFDFEKETIHFIEVKTGKSKLTDRQKIIKKIVDKGNVKFNQIKIMEDEIVYE